MLSRRIARWLTRILRRLYEHRNRKVNSRQKERSTENSRTLVIYRTSETGYKKIKPPYINNRNCIENAFSTFPPAEVDWIVIADNCTDESISHIAQYISLSQIKRVSCGNGAATFRIALEIALQQADGRLVYFLENDYLHRDGSLFALQDGLAFGDYVTLYDHPDYYRESNTSRFSALNLGAASHWRTVLSTTMTFASRVATLREDKRILEKWTDGIHPFDHDMFFQLSGSGRVLVSPIPGFSTHGETALLSPLIEWQEVGVSRRR